MCRDKLKLPVLAIPKHIIYTILNSAHKLYGGTFSMAKGNSLSRKQADLKQKMTAGKEKTFLLPLLAFVLANFDQIIDLIP
jgi:hypothetical protein